MRYSIIASLSLELGQRFAPDGHPGVQDYRYWSAGDAP